VAKINHSFNVENGNAISNQFTILMILIFAKKAVFLQLSELDKQGEPTCPTFDLTALGDKVSC